MGAALTAMLCSGAVAADQKSQPVALKWSELARLVQGRQVEIKLPDGATLKGEAVVVREDALVIGNTTVPRASLTLIKLQRPHGSWGRKLGTVLGSLTGLVVGGYVASRVADSAGSGIPLFLGMASAGTLGGYYLGRAIDHRTTWIMVLP
ncbi:MAG TPA: hypothetical protein VMZ52_17665 [Bryobacteraceae bacterium]|nr:hypothetical protein [Bryobacteraceae bacterium]